MHRATLPAIVIIASLAFAGFSYVYAGKYADLRADYTKHDETAPARHAVHRTVQVVSWAYYLAVGVFFAMTARGQTGAGRWGCWLGAAVGAVMIGWTLLLGENVSFDEVAVAWMGTAILLAALAWSANKTKASETRTTMPT